MMGLFGEDLSDSIEVIRPPLMPERAKGQLAESIGNVAAVANLGAQTATAMGAFQGLVQLTPATMEALQFAAPLTSGGVNLGSLVDASGHIVHSVQWVPAGATGLAAGLAAVGPAVAMLAVQLQLAKISSLVSENLRLTDELLRAVRIERWAEVEGLHEAMLKAVGEAGHIGEVSDPIWQNVASHEAELDKVRHEFLEKVATHAAGLGELKGHSERREFLVHHGEAILRDTQALFRAQAAWFTYQAVRAGHLHYLADSNPTNAVLLEKVVADARAGHQRDLQAARQLLRQLHWEASLMAELPGKRTLPFGKSKRAAKDVAASSRRLRKQLALLGEEIDAYEPQPQTPELSAFEDGIPDLVPRVLQWHLVDDEKLLALTTAKAEVDSIDDWSYIAVTDRRLLVADRDALKRRGEVGVKISLDDVRYVRFEPSSESSKARSSLDVITPALDGKFRFGAWAGEGGKAEEVEKIARLLRSRMHLPPEEVPTSPLGVPEPSAGPAPERALSV